MRDLYGLLSFFLSIVLMSFLIRAGLDVPDWAVGLSLMIVFMYFCTNPADPAAVRVMIFLVGQCVLLVQIILCLLIRWGVISWR